MDTLVPARGDIPETDSLYIELAARPGADARNVAERVVIDLDADGKIVGIDIQHASEMAALSRIDLRRLNVSALSRVDVPVRELVAGPAM